METKYTAANDFASSETPMIQVYDTIVIPMASDDLYSALGSTKSPRRLTLSA